MSARERILLETRLWRTEKENLDKDYFKHLTRRFKPSMLWIESFGNMVSVAELTNTEPDEIIVYRNTGGQCKQDDLSFMSALETFVEGQDAQYIVVCGHSHCPVIRDTIAGKERGAYSSRWTEDIHELHDQHAAEMMALPTRQQEKKLNELNVRRQLQNLSTIDLVQRAWSEGRKISLLGWYLDLHKGEVQEVCSMVGLDMLTGVAARQ
ncbi:MAG TPA: carbonic anhydrase [Chryseolinea sp.]|nr:carbonic anhydrase [Chryseolinea sp.]